MQRHQGVTRRHALQSAAAGAIVGWSSAGGRSAVAAEPPRVKITEPFHGAVLNHRHGKQTADRLTIRVTCEALPDQRVSVNGVACRGESQRFQAEVPLLAHETDLIAVAEGPAGRSEDRVRVVWDRYSQPRYAFSIDDCSFFLRDIAQKQYASLFDCFFLKMLRDLHRKYGTIFGLNIYYTTGDDFRLPQFPDRYQGQWRDNAHWLRLAFHAYANEPGRPYQDAPPEKLAADVDLVAAEIRRFAGAQTYAPPVIHFGMVRHTVFPALYQRGVRVMSGLFYQHKNGRWDLNYNWDAVRSEYMSRHDAWKDFQSGIVFSKIDLISNLVPKQQTAGVLAALAQDPNTAEIMDLFTHEQYFWPFYPRYIPDHPQRLEAALRWLADYGYKPAFLHDGFLGGRT